MRVAMIALWCSLTIMASHFAQVTSDCTPTSDFDWTKNGDTWYAETKEAGSWMHNIYACALAEHPHTTLAHVHDESTVEHLHRKQDLLTHPHWVGGTRLGPRKSWVWFTYKDVSTRKVTPIDKFFWAPGQPVKNHNCLTHDARTKDWKSELCTSEFRGICQFKCT